MRRSGVRIPLAPPSPSVFRPIRRPCVSRRKRRAGKTSVVKNRLAEAIFAKFLGIFAESSHISHCSVAQNDSGLFATKLETHLRLDDSSLRRPLPIALVARRKRNSKMQSRRREPDAFPTIHISFLAGKSGTDTKKHLDAHWMGIPSSRIRRVFPHASQVCSPLP